MVDLTGQGIATGMRSATLSRRMRWFWAGIMVGILLAIGYTIRQPVEAGISTVEGFYTPNVQYGAWYLANNYRLFDAEVGVPRISNYTSGLIYGAINYTYTFVNGAALILSGANDIRAIGRLYIASPWPGLFLIPLAAAALYGWACRNTGSELRPAAVALLYAFAAFPNYPMIVWALSGGTLVPLGWALFFGIYLAILARRFEERFAWQWAVMMVLCLLLLQPTYHTAAMALTVFLVSLWLIQRHVIARYLAQFTGFSSTDGGITAYLRNRTVQLVVVVFLSFLLYHAVSMFNDYGRFFFRFLSDIYRSDDHERLKYSLTGANVSIWWHIVNYAAVLTPVVWIALRAIRRRFQSEHDAALGIYPLSWLAALGPLVVLLFAWDGVYGVYARLLQYGTLLAIASAALLLATRPQTLKWLALAAGVCVVCSAYLTNSLGVSSSNSVTDDELAAVTWVREQRGCDTVLFTDFRIGPTMGYQGCFAVIGPTAGTLSRRNQIDRLSALLYDADSQRLAEAIDQTLTVDGRRPDAVLLSRRFMDEQIGFVLPDTRLRPMTAQQWDVYQTLPGWRVAYENETTVVLVRGS